MPETINESDKKTALTLFGGAEGWSSSDWTASDDRVRGGKSQSHLDCTEDTACFYGTLDIETLGGAGFASQRTTGDDREWDLSEYVGIQLDIAKGDKKRYTFILKDELLPRDARTGREQASISWECDFELPPQDEPGKSHDESVFIPWKSFNPTYRGKPEEDAEPLDLESVKRMSIMIRSFFGTQEGDFELKIKKISALCKTPSPDDAIVISGPLSDRLKDFRGDIQIVEAGGARVAVDPNYYSFDLGIPGLIRTHLRLHRYAVMAVFYVAAFLAAYKITHWLCH